MNSYTRVKNTLSKEIVSLNNAKEKIINNVKEIEAKQGEVTKQLASARTNLAEYQQVLTSYTTAETELTHDLKLAQGTPLENGIKDSLTALQAEIGKVRKQCTDQEKTIANHEKDLNKLADDLSILTARLTEIDKEITAKQASYARFDKSHIEEVKRVGVERLSKAREKLKSAEATARQARDDFNATVKEMADSLAEWPDEQQALMSQAHGVFPTHPAVDAINARLTLLNIADTYPNDLNRNLLEMLEKSVLSRVVREGGHIRERIQSATEANTSIDGTVLSLARHFEELEQVRDTIDRDFKQHQMQQRLK